MTIYEMVHREKKSRFKLNNKGLSLIELIIAITILSVAVAPLLYSFVRSSMINKNARIRQRATNAAQQIMENFKAYDLMPDPDAPSATSIASSFAGGSFLNSQDGVCTYSTSVDGNGFGTYTITGFSFSDGANAADEPVLYDAIITVEQGAANAGLGADATVEPLLNIDYMDSSKDGIYQDQESIGNVMSMLEGAIDVEIEDIDFLAGVADEITDKNFKYADDLPVYVCSIDNLQIDRKIDLSVGGSGGASFKYAFSAYVNYYVVTEELNPPNRTVIVYPTSKPHVEGEFEKTEGRFSGSPTRNMYFFYYPFYKADAKINYGVYDAVSADEDNLPPVGFSEYDLQMHTSTFTADSSDELKVNGSCDNLFVYKQKSTTANTASESTYKLEGTAGGSNIYTNLYLNVCDGSSLTVSHPFVAKADIMNNQDDMDSYYSSVSEDTQMMYSIKVEVWETGKEADEDALVSMSGTRYEKTVLSPVVPGP